VNIGLDVTEPGREDDPLCIIPASPLDAPALEGPLTKDRREDLQILAFTHAVSLAADGGHPIDIRPGGDPPDRLIRVNGREQTVELTELTVFDVRHELALARQVGRALRERLNSDALRNAYLVGRRVALAVLPSEPLPRDTELLLDKLCVLLAEDRGCVGDGVDSRGGCQNVGRLTAGLTDNPDLYTSVSILTVSLARFSYPQRARPKLD
jgi:hypothetical protein